MISPKHSFIFWAPPPPTPPNPQSPSPRNNEKVFLRPIDLVLLFDILAFKFLFPFFILTGHIEEDRSLHSLWPRSTNGKCQYNRCCRAITIYIAGYYRQIPQGKSTSRCQPHLQHNVIKHKRPLQKYTCAEAPSHSLFVWLPTIFHPAAPEKQSSKKVFLQ